MNGPLRALFAFASLALAAPLQAQECTPIDVVPYTISQPGRYCLTQDASTVVTTGAAIQINASWVDLDLRGNAVGGTGVASTQIIGIQAYGQTNIHVHDGEIWGFDTGVSIDGPASTSRDHVIENLRVMNSKYAGIRVGGQNVLVRGNEVLQTGGSTAHGAFPSGVGIFASGTRNVIERNHVATVTGSYPSGILVNPSSSTVIEGNRVVEVSYGVNVQNSPLVAVVGNRVLQSTWGVLFQSSTGRYRDNLTLGVTTPYTGGTDVGNNQ